MTYPSDKPNRRPTDDGGLSMSVGIIAAFAIALVVGLAFWTLNDTGRITAMNTAPSEPGITTGIAPPAK
jgi:predicted RND superfamily exporter protein